jgi:DNA polymerase III delta prime subunit
MDELNVKEVIINESQIEDVSLDTTLTEALKQEGDMRKLIRAVQDMRKEKGLQTNEEIVLLVSSKELIVDDVQLRVSCKIKEIKESKHVSHYGINFESSFLQFDIEE